MDFQCGMVFAVGFVTALDPLQSTPLHRREMLVGEHRQTPCHVEGAEAEQTARADQSQVLSEGFAMVVQEVQEVQEVWEVRGVGNVHCLGVCHYEAHCLSYSVPET
jgi:hypothetical protein